MQDCRGERSPFVCRDFSGPQISVTPHHPEAELWIPVPQELALAHDAQGLPKLAAIRDAPGYANSLGIPGC